MAKNLRGKRVKAGAMMSSKIKVAFRLNEEGKPTDCEPYSRLEANILVEEVSHDTMLSSSG